MFFQPLLICAAAAAIELDVVQAGQIFLSRPSVAGLIYGFLGGDFITGLQMGLCMELLTLDQVPVGGYVPPSGVIGAACAFMLAHYSGFDGGYAFFLGFLTAALFASVETKLRHERSKWNPKIEAQVLETPAMLERWIYKGFLQQLAAAFLFCLSAFWICSEIGWLGWELLPARLKPAFSLSYRVVPWIGMASLASLLMPRKAS
jgi:mannose/fructose/N-acetylgalactosamine-specific phosphotransferase system component IIC